MTVVPPAGVTQPIPEPSVRRLCLRKEVQVAASQRDELLRRRRLPADNDQAAGHVVDAVAVLMPRHDALSVLKQADVISQPLQVPERSGRVTHAGAPARSPASDEASSR